MTTITINGLHLCGQQSGIHRYMIECLTRIDKMLEGESLKIEMVYPWYKRIYVPKFKHIKVKRVFCCSKDWYHEVLPKYLKKRDRLFCGMANDIPCGENNIICLHDINPVKQEFKFSKEEVAERMRNYVSISEKSKIIVTVSETSKNDICDMLKVLPDRVRVIYNSWEHMRDIEEDRGIFEVHPELKKKKYYYALGNIMPHKNLKWIAQVAKKNPDTIFAVAGNKHALSSDDFLESDNVIYLGRVTDGENKSLMENCKAFLHPAFYEGFGIPPLEALACGAPIIISNSSCLPEIYKNSAHYVSPYEYEYDLNKLLNEEVEAADKVLSLYSWDESAKRWMDIFREASK